MPAQEVDTEWTPEPHNRPERISPHRGRRYRISNPHPGRLITERPLIPSTPRRPIGRASDSRMTGMTATLPSPPPPHSSFRERGYRKKGTKNNLEPGKPYLPYSLALKPPSPTPPPTHRMAKFGKQQPRAQTQPQPHSLLPGCNTSLAAHPPAPTRECETGGTARAVAVARRAGRACRSIAIVPEMREIYGIRGFADEVPVQGDPY